MSLNDKIDFACGADENGPFYEISAPVKAYQRPSWSVRLNLNDLIDLVDLINAQIFQKAKLWEHRNILKK